MYLHTIKKKYIVYIVPYNLKFFPTPIFYLNFFPKFSGFKMKISKMPKFSKREKNNVSLIFLQSGQKLTCPHRGTENIVS